MEKKCQKTLILAYEAMLQTLVVHTFYFYFLGHCVSTTSNSNTDGGAGYVSPRPGSTIQCGCQNGSTQYQNLTDHSCEEQVSTSSVA